MEFIEGLIIGFFGGVVPPLLILSMTNDAKARKECLYSIYELRNEFEKLAKVQRNTARTEKEDYDCLMNIRNILQKISVQKTLLTFSYYPMDCQVEKCLSRIKRMDMTDQNPHYHIVQTGTCVLLDWGKTESMHSEFERLKNIEWFLQRSFPMRCILWISYLFVRLKEAFFSKKC